MADEKIKKLLVNVDQQLTEPEKAQGRANLGIEGVLPQHVLTYDQQTLSTAQKLQVKQNLGFVTSSDLATVATSGDYNDLNNRPTIPPSPVQSDWSSIDTTSLAYIQNKPQNLVQDANYVHTDENFTSSEKTKLAGIAAGAEVNVQANWTETNASSDSYIQNKPSLAAIATSGSWNDLSDVPSDLVHDASYVHTDNNFTTTLKDKLDGIAAGAEVNVQANWTETNTSSDSFILNKPSLATVATSGSYNDLTDKPAIPGVYDSTITIQKNSTTVDSFKLNQATDKTINITVPTQTSDLTNNSGFVSSTSAGNDMFLTTNGSGTATWLQKPVQRAYFDNRGDIQYECANGIEIYEEEESNNRRVRLLGAGGSGYTPLQEGYLLPTPSPSQWVRADQYGNISWDNIPYDVEFVDSTTEFSAITAIISRGHLPVYSRVDYGSYTLAYLVSYDSSNYIFEHVRNETNALLTRYYKCTLNQGETEWTSNTRRTYTPSGTRFIDVSNTAVIGINDYFYGTVGLSLSASSYSWRTSDHGIDGPIIGTYYDPAEFEAPLYLWDKTNNRPFQITSSHEELSLNIPFHLTSPHTVSGDEDLKFDFHLMADIPDTTSFLDIANCYCRVHRRSGKVFSDDALISINLPLTGQYWAQGRNWRIQIKKSSSEWGTNDTYYMAIPQYAGGTYMGGTSIVYS